MRLTEFGPKRVNPLDAPVEKRKAPELFTQIEELFRHVPQTEPLSAFVLHRFLSSVPDYAQVAKELQKDVRNDAYAYEIWRAALPFQLKPPRLQYAGPRKAKAADALVARLMSLEGWSRAEAEENVTIITMAGKLDSTLQYYGIDPKAVKGSTVSSS